MSPGDSKLVSNWYFPNKILCKRTGESKQKKTMSGNIKSLLEELSSLDTEVKASHYICTQCEFVGKYYQALRNHKEKVHGVVYRQFPCDNCSYKARSEQRLSEHILLCENAWKAHEEENKAFKISKKSLKSCKE